MTETIAPGHHLYAGPDGTWRSCDPAERFARLSGPADLLALMRDRAHDGEAPGPDLEPLAAVLRARGVLTRAQAPEPAPIAARVLGDGPVAAQVTALLRTAEHVTLTTGPADVTVACAGWLPDERWQALDRDGTVWHRCHVEGLRLVLGPMSVPGRTPSYRDVRGRRLAASPLPDELAALWSHLDDGVAGRTALPPVPWPNAGAVATAAGLLVNDVLTWRDTGTPATGLFQLVLDPASGTVSRHPVLPLPVA